MNERRYGYGFYFKLIQSSIEKIVNETLREFDLTLSQEKILRFLRWTRMEKVSQRQIEEFYHISNPTVTGLLNRLEQKGYIQRIPGTEDKRIRYIEMTPKANELEKAIHKSILDFESRIKKGLSPEEQETLFILLEKVANNLTEKEDKKHA